MITNIQKAEQLQKEDKFSIRSCWECNHAHERLKKASGLYTCYDCERWFINGDFLSNEKHCNKKFEEKQ